MIAFNLARAAAVAAELHQGPVGHATHARSSTSPPGSRPPAAGSSLHLPTHWPWATELGNAARHRDRSTQASHDLTTQPAPGATKDHEVEEPDRPAKPSCPITNGNRKPAQNPEGNNHCQIDD